MSAVLERCIAAKSRAQVAPVTPPHWRREIQGDAGRYDGAFSYALPGAAKTLEIAETAASTGTKVWDCAVALSRMFERHQHTSSRLAIRPNERVLELGGGSGLLALALAALGADVTTTDAAPVVPHLRKTIRWSQLDKDTVRAIMFPPPPELFPDVSLVAATDTDEVWTPSSKEALEESMELNISSPNRKQPWKPVSRTSNPS